jgi:hypothetical protein
MTQRLSLTFLGLFALLGPLVVQTMPAEAQQGPDYDLPSGAHFYTQTDGAAGATGMGFAVSNAEGIPFLDYFRSNGGVSALGYPVSHRFRWNGFTVQAFQKVVFQWRPEARTVFYVNVLDEMHDRGLDPTLQTVRQVPPEADWSSDTGLSFAQVSARHLALLDANPAIAAAYQSEPDTLSHNGLPMAPIQNMGNVMVLRAQRKIYQQWLSDVPWAKAGQVVTANGGDLGKEFNVYPAAATKPAPASTVPLGAVGDVAPPGPTATATVPGPTATPTVPGPTATATGVPGVCNGDELMTFDRDPPATGQAFNIMVTSAKPSSNVNLTGTDGPKYVGVGTGGKGTIWTWTVTPVVPGRHDYTFTISGTVCTTNYIDVVGDPVAGPTPTISSGACQGDEQMSFDPDPPSTGATFYIRVTSARPSGNVSLSGPGNPSFAGVTGGGKGNIWSWTANVGSPGRADYQFKINNVVCTANYTTLEGDYVNGTPTPGPTPTVSSGACQGDEQMTFDPGTPGVNQTFRILVTSVRASTNVTLSGPGNPTFVSAGSGGKGTIWTWTVTQGTAGRYNYDFRVNNTVCTSNFVQVG